MSSLILLAAAALGVDYGWQPNPGGGFEYIIQIEPELLDALRAGEALRSDLPPFMRDVRSYRIQVGRGEVPKEGNPEAAAVQQPPAAGQEPAAVPASEPAREEPPATSPRGRWSPYDEKPSPPMQPPRSEPRYPNYNLRTETPPPNLPANEPAPPRPVDDDSPRRFQPDPSSTALVQQTSAYGAQESKPAAAETAPSAKSPVKVEDSKPWLPLTFALLCLFVSLGGNAYLGLQWWSIRQRCQQLLRDRCPGGGPHTPAHKSERRFAAEEEADEDQDVRAISEDELARSKRRRNGG